MNAPELRDIHLPEASLWWPLAPGWWLLALLLVILALACWWLLHRLRRRSISRSSLGEFQRIREAHRDGQPGSETIRQIAALLRRVLISYRGRDEAGASTGAGWMRAIAELASGNVFSEQQLQLLAHDRYRRDCDCDIESLLEASEAWIRALPGDKDHAAA